MIRFTSNKLKFNKHKMTKSLLKVWLLLLTSISMVNYLVSNHLPEKKSTNHSEQDQVRYLQNVFENITIQKDNAGIIGFVNLWGTPDEKWSKLDIDKNDPPTIMVHGTEDKLVSYGNSVDLAERLKANNIKHELITIEGAGHTPVKHMDEFEIGIADFLYDILN